MFTCNEKMLISISKSERIGSGHDALDATSLLSKFSLLPIGEGQMDGLGSINRSIVMGRKSPEYI